MPFASPRLIVRKYLAPTLALSGIVLSSTVARAITQAKPALAVETERSPQGARLTFKGKGWGPNARVGIKASRAPGSNRADDFGLFSADSTGTFTARKVAACSTNNVDDGSNEQVTFTATDSASGAKVTTRVQGGAWVCQ